MRRKSTKEEFVGKAIKKHGDWYDYSKVVYVDAHTKVCIICPIHGEFWQTPGAHLMGQGCPHCKIDKLKKNKIKTQEQVIKDFKNVHGDWYDYSKVVYVNSRTKVCIICPIHGEFWQRPSDHLSGNGCPHCASNKVKKMNTKTQEQIVKEFREVHGDFYDYSKVEYVNWGTKVCIICPIHGEFWQTPHVHLRGSGCPHCGGNLKLTKEVFVERSILVHGDFYDYSKVEYVNWGTKVCIICPDHGEFWQTPGDHLSGNGCPHCNKSNLENNTKEILNENNINFIQNYRGFDWLKNIKRLELDFYLIDYSIGIECQGRQHFESVKGWGGDEGLEKTQYRDNIKKQLCEEHGVNLFYINYDDNVEEKMKEIFLLLENNK
jgi:predicted  nucleic acid-binding Zn-ribbon protein